MTFFDQARERLARIPLVQLLDRSLNRCECPVCYCRGNVIVRLDADSLEEVYPVMCPDCQAERHDRIR